jgi:SAM-dependent methyltransferase
MERVTRIALVEQHLAACEPPAAHAGPQCAASFVVEAAEHPTAHAAIVTRTTGAVGLGSNVPFERGLTAEPGALAPLLAELIAAQHELRYHFVLPVVDEHARVLDVGCGTADGGALLASTGARVVGVDRATRVDAARRRVPDSVELLAGSLPSLPVETESFDVVLCLGGFDRADDLDPKAALDELLRPLVPSGLLAVAAAATRDGDDDEVDAAALAELLTNAGFRVSTYEQDAWLYAAIHDGRIPLMIDSPERSSAPALVLASRSPLPTLEPVVGAVTDLGVALVRELQAGLARELHAAHERAERAEHHHDEIAALAARLAAAERELATMLELELAFRSVVDERDALHAERTAVLAELDVARTERDSARGELDAFRHSTTWRLTAPLRWVSAKVRGVPYA